MMRRILAALAVSVLLIVGAPAPAQAAWSDCGNYPGTFCLFAHSNWGTPIWRQFPWQISGCVPLHGFNDVTSHVANNTAGSHLLRLWEHGDCTGWHLDIGSQLSANLGGTAHNDGASGVEDIEF